MASPIDKKQTLCTTCSRQPNLENNFFNLRLILLAFFIKTMIVIALIKSIVYTKGQIIMQISYQKLIAILCLFLGFHASWAQISSGGTPLSLSPVFQTKYRGAIITTTKLPAFPLKKVLKEDQANTIGTRFAAPILVDLDFNKDGEWLELENGDRLWRLKIFSSGALGLSALYDDLYLPQGSKLFMYSESGTQILGAYTWQSNTPNHTFMTGFIDGETAVLEYYEPKAVRGEGRLHIFRIDHAYKKEVLLEKSAPNDLGFGSAAACNVNINCTQGNNWQKQKRGICRIIVVVEEGTGYCTGNLINNTENNGTPYILSAFHCQDGFTPKYDFWRYDFNYEATGCNNGTEPAFQSMLGSTLRASRRQNDFLLLELSDTIPPAYNAYYNGWNRNPAAPASSVCIHHPRGDIKKIAIENQTAIIYGSQFQWLRDSSGVNVVYFTSPTNHLFRVQFDASTVEIGSSGSALFDPNGRIVGQLHGGTDLGSCTVSYAYFDRFSLSWEGGGAKENRLKDWLDPTGTNATTLNGIEFNSDTSAVITGFVLTPKGEGLAGVRVMLGGPVSQTTTTDTTGAYFFNNLPAGNNYNISLTKDYNDGNGVSVLDAILMSKHILSTQPLNSPYKLLAADVNDSKSITVLDIIEVRKLILGLETQFKSLPSWRFMVENFEFSDPENPWEEFFPTVFQVPGLSIKPLNFIGYKTGDADYSANSKN